jgi:protein-S-isoprenylcysteine O-methyltransferase Ste14
VSDAAWTRAAAIYVPLMAAAFAGLLRRGTPRLFAACLLSLLWAVSGLLIVQRLNLLEGWWGFSGDGILFRGMPLELYIGWVLLWGLVPQLLFSRLAVGWCAAAMIVVDLATMPLCGTVVRLGPQWLAGETVAAVLVLFPALYVARWTLEDSRLRLRAAMQVAMAGMLFLFVVPEIAFVARPGRGWEPLLSLSGWQRQAGVQMVLLLAVPGVSAVMEFAERGRGTPIPYDPPQRLVTSGMYRYCANPMQLSCALVMLGWAALLRNGWLVAAAMVSLIYSAGIAEWDEREDLARRFGAEWREYRAAVHNWRLRWKPYHAGPVAQLYIAASCGPCSEVRRWLEARRPTGLQIVDAETLPYGSIRRMRYDPGDGSRCEDGVRAMGRALEHLHLGWALAGLVLRLPLLRQCIQMLMDASGLGPRLPERACQPGAEPFVKSITGRG